MLVVALAMLVVVVVVALLMLLILWVVFMAALRTTASRQMHQPGIEPGSHRWQRCILPLDH